MCLAAVLVVLGVVVFTGRWWRRRTERRSDRLSAPVRPLLLELVAADEPDPAVIDRLAALDDRTWRALEPAVASLLGKLRGEARAALVALLDRRGSIARAVRGTRRASAVVRAQSAELLGAVGDARSVGSLVRLLGDRSAEVRAVAVRALGRVGDPSSAQPLVEGLSRAPRLPTRLVMHSLLQIGTAAVPALTKAVASPDPAVRATVVEALGLIGAVSAAPMLVTVLGSDGSLEVRGRAARALGRVGAPAAVEPLMDATGPGRPATLRITAVGALGDLGAVGAVGLLTGLLDDPAHWIGHTAAGALVDLGPVGVAALRHAAAGRREVAVGHAREALSTARLAGRVLAGSEDRG